jgi:hypothetical protein
MGGFYAYGKSQYLKGYDKCALEHSIAAQSKRRTEHSAAVNLERQISLLEQKYNVTTKRILEVARTIPCDNLSPEFVQLFNELNSD